ncbi:hypothetical protein, partial [Rhizobium leguminosarum]|uniref:hypothetical protein n=1 Tax=Rhizobium leguminosarum TaxID=384 RepID=UPI0019D43392
RCNNAAQLHDLSSHRYTPRVLEAMKYPANRMAAAVNAWKYLFISVSSACGGVSRLVADVG